MLQRFPSVALLLLALLTSVVGGVVATAFCSSSVKAPACHEMVEQSHDTHAMHAMDVSDVPVATQEPDAGFNRFERPLEGCSHCISHSNLPRTALMWRQAEMPRQSGDVDEPEAVTNFFHEVLIPRTVQAREHAPPALSSPLHVRLNVFRI